MNKKDLSKKLNQELDETLFRFETIFNYYEENPDRINLYMEYVSKKKVIEQGNIKYLRDLCNEYYSLDRKIRSEYGIILGCNEEKRISSKDGEIKRIYVLKDNEGLDVDSDIIQRFSSLGKRIGPLRDKMNEIHRGKIKCL